MKIRTDFVTNSSSSSFIIATKNKDAVKKAQAILDYKVESMDEIEYYIQEHGGDMYDFVKSVGDDMVKYYNEGYDIYYTDEVSYHDERHDILEKFIRTTDGITVIYDEEL